MREVPRVDRRLWTFNIILTQTLLPDLAGTMIGIFDVLMFFLVQR